MKKISYFLVFIFLMIFINISGVYAEENLVQDETCTYNGYTIKYVVNGGNSLSDTYVSNGSTANISSATREGYTFDGWYYDSSFSKIVDTSTLSSNLVKLEDCTSYVVLYAKWVKIEEAEEPKNGENQEDANQEEKCNIQGYTIRYVVNGGNSLSDTYVSNGSTANISSTTKEGYTFDGWYYDSLFSKIADASTLSSNLVKLEDCTSYVVLYAKWIKIEEKVETVKQEEKICTYEGHNVIYNTNGGNKISTLYVKVNQTNTKIATPTRNDYKFDGWYYDKALTKKVMTTSAARLSNIIKPADCSTPYVNIYAKWIKEEEEKACTYEGFNVIYNTNGGSDVENQFVKIGSTDIKLADVVKENYTFGGWYYDEEFNSKVETTDASKLENIIKNEDCSEAHVNLYAKWVTVFDSNNISLILVEGMSDDIKGIKIESISDTSKYLNYSELNNSKYAVYEINLLNSNNEYIQPSRRVSVSIDVPSNFDKNNLIVYLVDGDKLIPYDVIVEENNGNYRASFDTDHFSTYILAENITVVSLNNNKFIYMVIVASIMLAVTLFIALKFRKNK